MSVGCKPKANVVIIYLKNICQSKNDINQLIMTITIKS
jgi:hypothetical protein